MKSTEQTKGQSIYEHGRDVWWRFVDLYLTLKDPDLPYFLEWKLPNWIFEYKDEILNSLAPKKKVIEEYMTFHDCGKVYCREVDSSGKVHFPNHAQVSYDTWMKIDGNERIGNLILNDMKIHTIKDCDIEDFLKIPDCVTLLISGLCEIHSNADRAGGIQSTNFKIKYKQIDRRGKEICKRLFKDG